MEKLYVFGQFFDGVTTFILQWSSRAISSQCTRLYPLIIWGQMREEFRADNPYVRVVCMSVCMFVCILVLSIVYVFVDTRIFETERCKLTIIV